MLPALLLLLLLLALLLSPAAGTLGPNSKLCKSLYLNQRNYLQHRNITLMRQQLQEKVAGCQYVNGDVIVENIGVDPITDAAVGNASRWLTSEFLDSIVEISGRLRVFRVNMQILEFKQLRAIRGYNPNGESPFYSLEIRHAKFPLRLRLPLLGAVLAGDVALTGHFDVRPYCHLALSVGWTGVLHAAHQRHVDQVSRLTDGDKEIDLRSYRAVQEACAQVAKCAASCPTDAAGKGLCWSDGQAGCQLGTRCSSSMSCYSGMCFRDEQTGAEGCCHSSCIAGCSGLGPADCEACSSVNFAGSCMPQCPANKTFDPGSGTMKQLGSGMLQVGNICVRKCPEPFVTDANGQYCLSECPPAEIPVDGRCASCAAAGGSDCSSCRVPMVFDDAAATQLRSKSCSVWRTRSLTVKGSSIGSNATLPTLLRVGILYGSMYVRGIGSDLAGNLHFLRNLRHASGDIVLMQLRASYLALASLRSAKSLYLRDISGLCPAWLPLKWLRQQRQFKFFEHKLRFDNSSSECKSARCHPQCSGGCWGPGQRLCVACRSFSVNGSCVATCQEAGSFAQNVSGQLQCRRCHAECAGGCSGPAPADCDACRHFAQAGQCVPACAPGLQADAGGTCGAVAAAGFLLAGAAAVAALLLLLLLASVGFYARRVRKGDFVDIDEILSDPDDPNDMTQLLIVNNDDLVKQKVIGSGAFGTVYRGQLRTQTPRGVKQLPVAIKVLRGCSPQLGQELLHEAGVLARVRHQHCIRLVALCLTAEVQLITALMPRGCLLDFLQDRRDKLGAVRMLNWALQVAQGMQHLHSLGIVHRDLAARNVLLQTPDLVKITDFGLARLLPGGELQQQQQQQPQAAVSNERLPVKWLGVEYFDSGQFSHQSDVWSYGVLLWEICTFGESPYASSGAHTAEEICALLRKGVRLPQPDTCSVNFYNIMLSCWLPQPQSRPTFKELEASMGECLDRPSSYIASRGSAGQKSLTDELLLLGQAQRESNVYTSEPAAKPPANIYVPDPADEQRCSLIDDGYLVPQRKF